MTERFTSFSQRPYPWPGLSRDKQALSSLDRTEILCRLPAGFSPPREAHRSLRVGYRLDARAGMNIRRLVSWRGDAPYGSATTARTARESSCPASDRTRRQVARRLK